MTLAELEALAHYITAHALAGHRLIARAVIGDDGIPVLLIEELEGKFTRDDDLYDRALELLNSRVH